VALTLLALASLALVAGLLAIPVELRFHAVGIEEAHVRLRVEWLFGRVGWNLEQRGTPGGEFEMPDWNRLSPLWQTAFREVVARLLRRCRRWVDVAEIRGRARVGLGDPADTGMAIGILQPVLVAVGQLPRVDLRVYPDFEEAKLQGQLEGAIRAVPAGLVPPVIAFVLTPETLRTVRRLRSVPS